MRGKGNVRRYDLKFVVGVEVDMVLLVGLFGGLGAGDQGCV